MKGKIKNTILYTITTIAVVVFLVSCTAVDPPLTILWAVIPSLAWLIMFSLANGI